VGRGLAHIVNVLKSCLCPGNPISLFQIDAFIMEY
jgi:hypothetical protein